MTMKLNSNEKKQKQNCIIGRKSLALKMYFIKRQVFGEELSFAFLVWGFYVFRPFQDVSSNGEGRMKKKSGKEMYKEQNNLVQ